MKSSLQTVEQIVSQVKYRALLWGAPTVWVKDGDVICEFTVRGAGNNIQRGRFAMKSPERAQELADRLTTLFPMNETHKGENRPTA